MCMRSGVRMDTASEGIAATTYRHADRTRVEGWQAGSWRSGAAPTSQRSPPGDSSSNDAANARMAASPGRQHGAGQGDGGIFCFSSQAPAYLDPIRPQTTRSAQHALAKLKFLIFFWRTFFPMVRLCVGGVSCQLQDSYGGSAGSSPSGSSAPSLVSQGRIGSSSKLCACARRAASAASAVQRRVSAAIAAARAHGTRSRRERELAGGAARLLGDRSVRRPPGRTPPNGIAPARLVGARSGCGTRALACCRASAGRA